MCLKEPGFVSFQDTIHFGARRFDGKIKRNRAELFFISLSCRLGDSIVWSEFMRKFLTSLRLCVLICKMKILIVPTSWNCWENSQCQTYSKCPGYYCSCCWGFARQLGNYPKSSWTHPTQVIKAYPTVSQRVRRQVFLA